MLCVVPLAEVEQTSKKGHFVLLTIALFVTVILEFLEVPHEEPARPFFGGIKKAHSNYNSYYKAAKPL